MQTKFKLTVIASLLALAGVVTTIGGCGGDSSPAAAAPTPTVAAANAVVPVTAKTVAALIPATATAAPTTLTFNSGFSGTSASGAPVNLTGVTTVAFTAPPAGSADSAGFSMKNGSATAAGTVIFGSCSFKITSISGALRFVGLEIGDLIKVDPCAVTVNSAGKPTGSTSDTNVVATFGSTNSAPLILPVTIDSSGTVAFNGVVLATVNTTPVTGAN